MSDDGSCRGGDGVTDRTVCRRALRERRIESEFDRTFKPGIWPCPCTSATVMVFNDGFGALAVQLELELETELEMELEMELQLDWPLLLLECAMEWELDGDEGATGSLFELGDFSGPSFFCASVFSASAPCRSLSSCPSGDAHGSNALLCLTVVGLEYAGCG